MDENEELKQELVEELQWVQCRMQMLDIIDYKLHEMRIIAQKAGAGKYSQEELKILNEEIKCLLEQVKALDAESRKTQNERIF